VSGPPSALAAPAQSAIQVANVAFLLYFLLINTSYLVLIAFATAEFIAHLRSAPFAAREERYANPLTSGVSVIMPAYNEEATIVEAVSAMTALRYPQFEIVVVDDGCTDGTFERLREAYHLAPVPRVIPDDVRVRGRVISVHVPRHSAAPIVVVRKENGGKTDSLNAGLNIARHPLICMVDADCLLDPDALMAVSSPFAQDPLRVVATGGVIRVANGCEVVAGRVTDVRMPRRMLPAIQVVEYLRAFLLGRTGWSRLASLVIISGAFGLFRRDLVVEAGGLDPATMGEDAELVVRLHRRMRERRRDYRIVFVAEPVSWTEVPAQIRVLARQRRRWHRGLTEVLWLHRRLVGNPAYGRVGLLALPYFVVFELFAPIIELAGIAFLVLGLAAGAINLSFAWLFLLVAYGYGLMLTMVALTVEEMAFHRYRRWSDLGVALVASLAENFGYRQLTAVWRLQGIWAAIRRSGHGWGVMTRQGFVGGGKNGGRA
jgi:cellulose synthase/poly-beta-1,6-N-acetylglucosamine synthase-like glycosyltransferase